MSWIGNDICWCGNSYEHFKDKDVKCEHTDCFRHLDNRVKEKGRNIFTMSMLKDTEMCPYYIKKGEK